MGDVVWKQVAAVMDTVSAQAIAERLESEGVPVRVKADSSLLGEARSCEVMVPSELLHRARWLLSSDGVSEEELTLLATGELGDGAVGDDAERDEKSR
jgi:hypothetical protein